MRATDGTIRLASLRDSEHRRLVAQLLAASIIVVLAIGLFLLTRRAVGALSVPLPVPQLMGTAASICVWAIALRQFAGGIRFLNVLTATVLLMFAIACSYPGTRIADWLVWSTAIMAFVLASMPEMIKRTGPLRGRRETKKYALPADENDQEQVLQQLTRVRTEEGHDAVRGTLIGEFAPGERQVTLYIAFCPPFERLPHVEVNVADDSDATVKLAQFLHNGAQLEVRLSQPATEAANVELEFFATDAESPLAV